MIAKLNFYQTQLNKIPEQKLSEIINKANEFVEFINKNKDKLEALQNNEIEKELREQQDEFRKNFGNEYIENLNQFSDLCISYSNTIVPAELKELRKREEHELSVIDLFYR